MKLRDYRPDDFSRLCEIDRRCFRPALAYSRADMAAWLGRRGAVVIVAENARGTVAAFVLAETHARGRAHIVTVDVLPAYRGQGVGRQLMLECERRLRRAGARLARLETAVSNRAARKLYQSLGYTFVGRAARYYPGGEDAWVMEKSLHVRA